MLPRTSTGSNSTHTGARLGASSVRRNWLPLALAALALVLLIPVGWFVWGPGRSDSANVEASTTDAAFSFMPHLATNGLIHEEMLGLLEI